MNRIILLALFFNFFLPLHSAESRRIPWALDEVYSGSYQETFQKLRNEIQFLLRQTVIDVVGQIGLNYQEGWRYPLVVGFLDNAPPGAEFALAYVQLGMEGGEIRQDLRINLSQYEKEHFDFEKVLAHEITHAMLNDAMGAEASTVLPLWFHEGLAVYAANQGEQMLKSYVYHYGNSFLNGLDHYASAADYAENYLAFKYIHKKHGSNALHNFVFEVVKRKGDIPNALEYTCFEKWEDFLKNVMEFSESEIREIGIFKGRPQDIPQPY